MCADCLQHLHQTNRISSCYTKSLKKFFEGEIFVVIWSFSCLKTIFLDLYQEKLDTQIIDTCNTDIEMPYRLQLHLLKEKIPHTGDTNSLDRCG